MNNNFCIEDNYKCNLNENGNRVLQYNEFPPSKIYQVPAYKHVLNKVTKDTSILELGSGSGYKLNKYFTENNFDTYGMDLQHSIDHCKVKYTNGNWFVDNFDQPFPKLDKKFDVIISFDVIEHLERPDNFMSKIKQYSDQKTRVFISTPDRNVLYGENEGINGPPFNKLHVREWNFMEFKLFIEYSGFIVVEHIHLPERSRSIKEKIFDFYKSNKSLGIRNSCQLIECRLG